jgi:predicted acylesterase/phospholipase RssA
MGIGPATTPSTSTAKPDEHLTMRLADLLTDRFQLTSAQTERLVEDVQWRVFKRGDLTSPPGEGREWLILSGRMQRKDTAAEIGAGSFLQEGRAIRPLLVAGLVESAVDDVSVRAPELAVARALASRPAAEPARASVIAVVVGPGLDPRYEVFRLRDGLATLGSTIALWPRRVDLRLGVPGISQSEFGDPGHFAVAELLHRLEESHDHLVLELGTRPTAWSRRALESADHVAVVIRSGTDPAELDRVMRLLDHAPLLVERTLVMLGEPGAIASGSSDLLDRMQCDQTLHLDTGESGEADRIARTITGHATGLALSGGGARGFAHLGAYRALTELGVEVDIFGGSSIGTPLAAAMADGYPPDELEPLVARLFADVLDYTVPVVAFTEGRGIAEAAQEVFGDRHIEDLRRPFFGISTNLTRADMHVHRRGSVVHTIRASCAVPGLMPPVPHNGHLLVDGGVTNNLPIDVMRELAPYGAVLAADVVPREGPEAREEYGLWVSGTKMLRERFRGRRPAPPMSMTLMRALTVGSGNRHKEMQLTDLADHLIGIDVDRVPMFAFDRVIEIARRGYELALPQVESWLESRGNGKETSDVAIDAP